MNKLVSIFLALITFFLLSTYSVGAVFQVPPLPSNNLIRNPWFTDGSGPSLVEWIDTTGPLGFWAASDKDGNPTPFNMIGTSARLSTGRGEDGAGATIIPNYDAYLSQVVSADKTQTTLLFDLYWVAHTIKPAEFIIYGSTNPNGPWTELWKPFNKTLITVLIPPPGTGSHNEWLWQYYSNTTSIVSTTIPAGYPYYKIQAHVNLPDEFGGFKMTGIYFATSGSKPGVPTPTPTPFITPSPIPISIRPSITPTITPIIIDPTPTFIDPGDIRPLDQRIEKVRREDKNSIREVINDIRQRITEIVAEVQGSIKNIRTR